MKPHIKKIVRIEYFVGAILVLGLYSQLNFSWYWIPLLFFVIDISLVGYLINNKIGAILYNLFHSLIGPGLLLAAYIFVDGELLFMLSLIWFFHIFVDRALGLGLKHYESFNSTHLGTIGKASK